MLFYKSDKKMRRMYNPIVSKVSALYEPRYGVDSHWGKNVTEMNKNWIEIFLINRQIWKRTV